MYSAQILLASLILSIMVIVGVWDIACYAVGKPERTISTILGYWSSAVPALPFALGFIAGHILWPRIPWTPQDPISRTTLSLALAFGVASLLSSCLRLYQPVYRSLSICVLPMLSGYLTMTIWLCLSATPFRPRKGRSESILSAPLLFYHRHPPRHPLNRTDPGGGASTDSLLDTSEVKANGHTQT